jgi:hypothetical protein
MPYQKTTSYLGTYKGLMSKDIDLNIGDDLKAVSNFIGATSPDHTTYGNNPKKLFHSLFRMDQIQDDIYRERSKFEKSYLQALHVDRILSHAPYLQWRFRYSAMGRTRILALNVNNSESIQ